MDREKYNGWRALKNVEKLGLTSKNVIFFAGIDWKGVFLRPD